MAAINRCRKFARLWKEFAKKFQSESVLSGIGIRMEILPTGSCKVYEFQGPYTARRDEFNIMTSMSLGSMSLYLADAAHIERVIANRVQAHSMRITQEEAPRTTFLTEPIRARALVAFMRSSSETRPDPVISEEPASWRSEPIRPIETVDERARRQYERGLHVETERQQVASGFMQYVPDPDRADALARYRERFLSSSWGDR